MAVQALQYLRRLCSHPLLVLEESNPAHVAAAQQATSSSSWTAAKDGLRGLTHAPKLAALRDLLQQCGIVGEEGPKTDVRHEALDAAGEAPNRVLVFAQLRAVLDFVESDVLQPLGIPFLRLDGGCASILHLLI